MLNRRGEVLSFVEPPDEKWISLYGNGASHVGRRTSATLWPPTHPHFQSPYIVQKDIVSDGIEEPWGNKENQDCRFLESASSCISCHFMLSGLSPNPVCFHPCIGLGHVWHLPCVPDWRFTTGNNQHIFINYFSHIWTAHLLQRGTCTTMTHYVKLLSFHFNFFPTWIEDLSQKLLNPEDF